MIEGRTDYLGQKVLGQLHGRLPKPLEPFTLQFFKNVDVEPMDDDEFDLADDQQLARAAQRALGERNRWAVIAMDGNDMGRQFRRLDEDFKNKVITEAAYRRRVADASKRLREVTEQAFLAALAETLDFWLADRSQQELQKLLDACCVGANRDHHHARRLILPFRPLIVGGDDVVLLCHCSLAIPFVRSMSRHFTELSAQDGERIWPDTDRLTMSAGVLFTKSTLPLHIAIPYAENLLGSAKGPFRATQRGELSPAAVDWDNVTDSMVDTPAARRNRELRFLDCELDQEIRLTRRPYLLDEGQTNGSNQSGRSLDALLRAVDDLCNFPRSFLAKLPMVLRQPWSERVQFYTSIAKNKHYRPLAASLEESAGGAQNGCYWHLHSAAQGNARTSTASGTKDTSIVDAIALLEEDQRMQWRTVDAG